MLIRFNQEIVVNFEHRNFISLVGRTGLYFIFLGSLSIPYPFQNSRLIYIGMSGSRINSIGKRLKDHFSGKSNNKGIYGYKNRWGLKFTYLDSEFLKHVFPTFSVEKIETYFLENFSEVYGSYPICNNRRGNNEVRDLKKNQEPIKVDWQFYEE